MPDKLSISKSIFSELFYLIKIDNLQLLPSKNKKIYSELCVPDNQNFQRVNRIIFIESHFQLGHRPIEQICQNREHTFEEAFQEQHKNQNNKQDCCPLIFFIINICIVIIDNIFLKLIIMIFSSTKVITNSQHGNIHIVQHVDLNIYLLFIGIFKKQKLIALACFCCKLETGACQQHYKLNHRQPKDTTQNLQIILGSRIQQLAICFYKTILIRNFHLYPKWRCLDVYLYLGMLYCKIFLPSVFGWLDIKYVKSDFVWQHAFLILRTDSKNKSQLRNIRLRILIKQLILTLKFQYYNLIFPTIFHSLNSFSYQRSSNQNPVHISYKNIYSLIPDHCILFENALNLVIYSLSYNNFYNNYIIQYMQSKNSICLAEKENKKDVQELPIGPFSFSSKDREISARFEKNSEWTLLENAKYAAFIQMNRESMEKKKASNLWSKFVEMGKFIKSRNFRQCKLYHQRLVRQHSTINDIIAFHASCSPKFYSTKQKEMENLLRQVASGQLKEKKQQSELVEMNNVVKANGPTNLNYPDANSGYIMEPEKKNFSENFERFANKLKHFEVLGFCA